MVFQERLHSLETTAANVHDIVMAPSLIREDDAVLYGDAGYLGIEKCDEVTGNPHLSSIEYRLNQRVDTGLYRQARRRDGQLADKVVRTAHFGCSNDLLHGCVGLGKTQIFQNRT